MKQHHIVFGALATLVVAVLLWAPWKPAVAPSPQDVLQTGTEDISEVGTSAPSTDGDTSAPREKVTPSSGVSPITRSSPASASARYKELVDPAGYVNTDLIAPRANSNRIELADFIGKKIILLDFFSYASADSQRGLPYMRQLWSRYRDKGLMIIGIHGPEFTFEADLTNVRSAVFKANLAYPIVIDSFRKTWSAYGVKSAPRRIIIDLDGRIAYDRSGDGGYQELEKKIADLIFANSARLGNPTNIYQMFVAPEGAWTKGKTTTPDLLLGSARNAGVLGNLFPSSEGPQDAGPIAERKANLVYVTGSWNVTKEYLENRTGGAMFSVQYGASRVQAVLGNLKMARVKVTLDGQPLGDRAGKDIVVEKGESILYVADERLYDIVNDAAGYGEHTLEFTIDGTALQIYALRFG